MEPLHVSELFYAPQGEGARAGEMSAFVRLQGCSAKHACYASGVACDTEFESGKAMSVDAVEASIRAFGVGGAVVPAWIVWTGGEPLDQLTPDVVQHFASAGFKQAIETSGARPFPREFRELFDWVTCSPKVAEHVLAKHFAEPGLFLEARHGALDQPLTLHVPLHVHELRYVRHVGQALPRPALSSHTYFLSPHSDGVLINRDNVRHVIELCKQETRWRISVQVHKVWGVL